MELLSELRLANVRNGLAYPHDDLCYFQSNHGHRASLGYFRIDAMPLRAIVHLLLGRRIVIVDGTAKARRASDALTYGVPTWCAAYNAALGFRSPPCGWITDHAMVQARSDVHRQMRHTVIKLAEIYAPNGAPAALIGWTVHPGMSSTPSITFSPDANVILECHRGIDHDDRPEVLRQRMGQ